MNLPLSQIKRKLKIHFSSIFVCTKLQLGYSSTQNTSAKRLATSSWSCYHPLAGYSSNLHTDHLHIRVEANTHWKHNERIRFSTEREGAGEGMSPVLRTRTPHLESMLSDPPSPGQGRPHWMGCSASHGLYKSFQGQGKGTLWSSDDLFHVCIHPMVAKEQHPIILLITPSLISAWCLAHSITQISMREGGKRGKGKEPQGDPCSMGFLPIGDSVLEFFYST